MVWLEETDSTNLRLLELAKAGASIGESIAAKRQTCGRGRGENSFHSPEGGLYFSVLIPRDMPAGTLPPTPRAAIAVRRVLAAYGCETQIKWVNDIYKEGKKVCGILAQSVPGRELAVIGIGINRIPVALPPDIADSVGFCFGEGTAPSREALAERIRTELLAVLAEADNRSLWQEYTAYCLLVGRHITYTAENRAFGAYCTGISPDGKLAVLWPDGTEGFLSHGVVHIRPTA
ncbi:MAG: biotin--[acetyl-CoA-carboxylase] ligase [Oscillospiraceae bacterium]|jgi:BirA family biotin operon repressor/biotin-[acetyl-CoA-carboxylase] ligase|nr:biotin--[acetyl-CoA-carboxylase] ligase [Oscillospiraceae bacterium]